MKDNWSNATLYESYIGKWSRQVAPKFLAWINPQEKCTWLDIGCGTGALTETILKLKNPGEVIGIDPSESHIQFCREYFKAFSNTSFLPGDAANLQLPGNSIDVIVSGLVLNFIEDLPKALTEFKRTGRNNATLAGYVWDYNGKMELIRYFWNAAIALREDAIEKDEATRFPICNEAGLQTLFLSVGLTDIETTSIDIPTVFNDFNDFWQPFLSGQGPAPGYCMSLPEEERNKLKQKLFESLPIDKDGSIHLIARAIAIKSTVKE